MVFTSKSIEKLVTHQAYCIFIKIMHQSMFNRMNREESMLGPSAIDRYVRSVIKGNVIRQNMQCYSSRFK